MQKLLAPKNLIVFIILIITSLLWFFAKLQVQNGLVFNETLLYINELFALFGILLMSLDFILSLRFNFIENIFGGLDKMYKFHKKIGEYGFVMVWFHPLLLILSFISGANVFKIYLIPGEIYSYNWGMFSLYTLTILILFAIYGKMQYGLWKIIHKLMIIPLVFGVIHTMLIESDVSVLPILKIWILAWAFLGIAAFIYIEFFYLRIGPIFYYKISKINLLNGIIELRLEPSNRPIVFKAGQFVFVSILNNKKIPSELHPFSISSSPTEYSIRITVKDLGDYTSKLKYLLEGDRVKIIGPYGQFSSQKYKDFKKQIWVAGGIGVTPFLSIVNYEKAYPTENEILFFYTAKKRDEAVYDKEIDSLEIDKMKIIHNYDNENGFLSFDRIRIELPKPSEINK